MESSNCVTIYLKPGEYYVSREPVLIKTVLGSCVSVCLHDRVNSVGGANHFLLPKQSSRESSLSNYGEYAIPELIKMAIQEGADSNSMTAQVIGGSCSHDNSIFDVGKRNIEIARNILKHYSIPIISENVGGSYGRVIRFYPHSNELNIHRAGYSEESIAKTRQHENFVQLTDTQARYLRNKLAVGMKYAQTSLTTMTGSNVEISISEVTLRQMSYVQQYLREKFSDFLVCSRQKEKSPLGEVVLMFSPNKSPILVNCLLGRALGTQLQYDRMETSVIVEISNIMLNGIFGTLANQLGFTMMLRVPQFIRRQRDMLSSDFMHEQKKWKVCLALKANFRITALGMDTLLLFLVELASPYMFCQKLG